MGGKNLTSIWTIWAEKQDPKLEQENEGCICKG